VEYRNVNPLREKAYIQQITKLENANAYTEFLNELQPVLISEEENQQVSRLVNTIDHFFAQAKNLESTGSSHAMRQAFIDKAQEVSRAVTSASDKVLDLRLEADKRLKQSTIQTNNTLKALLSLNKQMLSSSSPIRLHDQRDGLIRDLAQSMDIKVTYGSSGTAIVQSQSSGDILVNNDGYAQFSYEGVLTVDDIAESAEYPPIIIHHFDKYDKEMHSNIFAAKGGSEFKSFTGGKWSALIDLRDRVLTKSGDHIKYLGRNFTDTLNKIHNNGSPFPPKDYFKSSLSVKYADTLNWQEPFTLHFVSKEGDQLRGGAGRLHPVTIDMNNLESSSPGGKATIADLLSELNETLSITPSRERAAMGPIKNAAGTQLANEFLLNSIQLRAKGPVNVPNNNSFVFDLELQGNSHFGSDIEILGVSTSETDGTATRHVASGNLPSGFRLEKDSNIATGQNIQVEDATADRVITLRVRVRGDNGTVTEGEVSFPVNADAKVNSRIHYDSLANVPAVSGDFTNLNLLTHTGIAKAMIIDDKGNEVTANSAKEGNLVITTNDDSYRLAIQGGNFGKMFGFNNLFEFDDKYGTLAVNQDIVEDVSKLSIGRVVKDAGISSAYTVGDQKAKATLEFVNPNTLSDSDTITIHGIEFTFVNALAIPANPNEVLVTDGLNGADGLVNRINAHPELKNLVEARLSGNIMSIEAKSAGTGGNNITVSSNLTTTIIALNNSDTSNGTINGNLINGTDKTENSTIYNYSMKSGQQQILEDLSNLQTNLLDFSSDNALPNTVTTLSGLATIITGLISDATNEAKIESDVAANVLERTDNQVKSESGINRDQEFVDVMDLTTHKNYLAQLASMLRKVREQISDIMFSR
jgi:flagellar hook-associated protein FlgK